MAHHRLLAVAAVAVAFNALGVSDSRATTLQEAAALAVSSHPTVQAAAAGRRAAEEDVNDARADFFPSVDVTADGGWEHTDDPDSGADGENLFRRLGRVSLTQRLFDGFATSSATEAAERRVVEADQTVIDRQEAIALRASEAFLDVIRARMVLRLARENVATHVKVRDDVQFRRDSGGGDGADLDQAESRLAFAQTQLTQAEGALRNAEADYREAVGSMPDTLETPAEPTGSVPGSVEDAVSIALDNNPALRSAAATIEARHFDKRAARAPFLPSLDFELSGSGGEDISGFEGTEVRGSALVVLRYNLYRGGRDSAKVRRAVALEGEAKQQRAELARLVEEQARIDFNDMRTAGDNLPVLQKRATSAGQVVTAYRQQFELGRRTLLDLLDVENELFQARIAVVNGEIAYRVAQYRVLATMGQLVQSLGVTATIAPTSNDAT